MKNNFAEFETTLGYQFDNPELLVTALTHRSASGEHNERLEFLGDAVLGLIMAQELFEQQPQAPEGHLSRMRSSLVNGDALAMLAKDLNVGHFVRLGSGEQKSGGQQRHSILSNTLEAVIGAIYLDSNFKTASDCVLRWYNHRFKDLSELIPDKDAKSQLQEWLQGKKYPLPIYEARVTGRAHAQTFHVTCRVDGLSHVAEGKSTSRRRAEQMAAQRYLEKISDA